MNALPRRFAPVPVTSFAIQRGLSKPFHLKDHFSVPAGFVQVNRDSGVEGWVLRCFVRCRRSSPL
jgi:hypothetical protein